MSIDGKQLACLFAQESDHPGFYNLIRTYCELRRKLEHPELQSWYFKKGVDTNRKRLAEIEVEYESRRAWFNEGTIDDFIEQRAEASDWMERG